MIVDREDLFSRLVNTTLAWPSSYRDKLQFSMHDIWYPEVGVVLGNIQQGEGFQVYC